MASAWSWVGWDARPQDVATISDDGRYAIRDVHRSRLYWTRHADFAFNRAWCFNPYRGQVDGGARVPTA